MKKITFFIFTSLFSLSLFSQVLTVELGSVPATAASQCPGKVWVHVTNGTAPYSFSWNTGETTTYMENLCLGTYAVTVTDALNATATATVTFSTSSQIIIPLSGSESVSNPMYNICEGNVYTSIWGGIEPYSFQLFNAENGLLISNTQSTGNLCAGNYYAVVSDVNNGIFFKAFTIESDFIRDFPSQFAWSYPIGQPVSFHIAGVPPINVSIAGTTGVPQQYTITNPTEDIIYTPQSQDHFTISLSDNAGHFAQKTFCTFDFNNLMTVFPQNATNGCDGAIISPNNLQISMNVEVTSGSSYTINATNYQLCPGQYFVMAFENFCYNVVSGNQITISGPQFDYPVPEVNSANTIYNSCTGMAWATATGGTAPYSYSWIDAYPTNTSDFINNLCTGYKFVKITDAVNVSSIGFTNIGADMPETVPGDTIYASQDTCIANITETYIYAYTINANTVNITWAIVQTGITTYLDVTYNYTITLPGTYNVALLINCPGAKNVTMFMSTLQLLTGIQNLERNSVSIYPNPVTEKLYIDMNKNISQIDIFSITGAFMNNYKAKGNQMILNVSSLNEGVYILRFTNRDGSIFTKRFVK
jgi:hypothetical protein